jgi:hypothetical protein
MKVMRIRQDERTTQTHIGQDDLLAEDVERLLRGKHLPMTAHLDYDRQESQGSGNELWQISCQTLSLHASFRQPTRSSRVPGPTVVNMFHTPWTKLCNCGNSSAYLSA